MCDERNSCRVNPSTSNDSLLTSVKPNMVGLASPTFAGSLGLVYSGPCLLLASGGWSPAAFRVPECCALGVKPGNLEPSVALMGTAK